MVSDRLDVGSAVDDPILILLLMVAGVGLLAPPVALLLSIRPSRATRPAGYVCAVVAAIAAVALGALVVDGMTTEVNEFGEGGDDSGMLFAMGAIAVLFLAANVTGWAVAHRRSRDDRQA